MHHPMSMGTSAAAAGGGLARGGGGDLSKGYDLEYIWAQVDRGPVKTAASYYLQASETGGEPPAAGGVRAYGLWAWNRARWSNEARMTCCSASAKPRTALRWADRRGMAAKPPTCMPGCWPLSRTLPLNAAANCAWTRPGRPGRARCSLT